MNINYYKSGAVKISGAVPLCRLMETQAAVLTVGLTPALRHRDNPNLGLE